MEAMGLTDFIEIVKQVLVHEGGAKVTKDPVDPGGTTKYGISQKAYPKLDIENLSEGDAIDIYLHDYWEPSKAERLPDDLKHIYFDMVVNMGKKRAVRILQKAINNKGGHLVVDGGIGKMTLGAVHSINLEPDRLRAFRVKYYANLVKKKPSLEKYFYGWFRRSLEV